MIAEPLGAKRIKESGQEESEAKAIWSLAWRSTLLIPLMLPIALVWLLVLMSIAVLPLVCALSLWWGVWDSAAYAFVFWTVLFWGYRRFRFGRIWEWPPSFL